MAELKLQRGHFRIRFDPLFLVALPLVAMLGYLTEYCLIYSSIILHETAHAAASILSGGSVRMINLMPVGMKAEVEEDRSDWKARLFVFAAGPLANLLFFFFAWVIRNSYGILSYSLDSFMLFNICLAIFNIIPVLPLDGGRILMEILSIRVGIFGAESLMRKITVFFALTVILLGILQFIGSGGNFSLLAAGVYIFFVLKTEKSEAAFMNIKNIVYRHRRLLRKGIYPARGLAAVKDTALSQIIKSMDFDRFHFIYALDSEMKFIKILTEQEIMDGMVQLGADAVLGDLLEKRKIK